MLTVVFSFYKHTRFIDLIVIFLKDIQFELSSNITVISNSKKKKKMFLKREKRNKFKI